MTVFFPKKEIKSILEFPLFTLLITLTLIFLMACFYPITFMADDWERLYAYYTDNLPAFLTPYYLRFFVQGLSTEYLFPLFIYSLPLGAFVFWSSLTLAAFFYLRPFTHLISTKSQLSHNFFFSGPILIFFVFMPNNYEWNFFPTVMTLLPVILLMSISFFFSHRPQTQSWQKILHIIVVVLGFYAYESLLPMAILFELAYVLYVVPIDLINKKQRSLFQSLLSSLPIIIPVVVLSFILKIISHHHQLQMNGNMQEFGYEWGYKHFLFWQFLQMSLNHDFYKIRWFSGSLSLIFFMLLLYGRYTSLKKENRLTDLKKDALIVLAYIVGSSYYFLIMNYSSRRALGGPLYFWWGFCSLALISLTFKTSLSRFFKISIWLFYLSSFFVHHEYIARQKRIDKSVYDSMKLEIQNKAINNRNAPLIKISLEEITQYLSRSWNLENPIQLHGFLKHQLQDQYHLIMPFKEQFPTYRFIYSIK